MIVIRRRADGLYFKKRRWQRKWVPDLQDATIRKIKPSVYTEWPPHLNPGRLTWNERRDILAKMPTCCQNSGAHRRKQCDHYKAEKAKSQAKWDAEFEIVTVKLAVVT